MGEERRAMLAAVARKNELTIIEDDVFGYLPHDRPPPLAAFAPERTILVTSASKCMAPGLRVGMVLTPPDLHDAVRHVVQMSCWMPAPLMTEIFHRWVRDGTADKLNNWLREEMTERLALARAILGGIVEGQQTLRMHLWLELPESVTEQSFQAAVEAKGALVAASHVFRANSGLPAGAVRLALGYEADRRRLEQGLRIVAQVLAEPNRDQPVVV